MSMSQRSRSSIGPVSVPVLGRGLVLGRILGDPPPGTPRRTDPHRARPRGSPEWGRCGRQVRCRIRRDQQTRRAGDSGRLPINLPDKMGQTMQNVVLFGLISLAPRRS